jgi:hypothetical protein
MKPRTVIERHTYDKRAVNWANLIGNISLIILAIITVVLVYMCWYPNIGLMFIMMIPPMGLISIAINNGINRVIQDRKLYIEVKEATTFHDNDSDEPIRPFKNPWSLVPHLPVQTISIMANMAKRGLPIQMAKGRRALVLGQVKGTIEITTHTVESHTPSGQPVFLKKFIGPGLYGIDLYFSPWQSPLPERLDVQTSRGLYELSHILSALEYESSERKDEPGRNNRPGKRLRGLLQGRRYQSSKHSR